LSEYTFCEASGAEGETQADIERRRASYYSALVTARRITVPGSRHLQYWDTCVQPSTRFAATMPIGENMHPEPLPGWPAPLARVLRRVASSAVGRALIRHPRRRTTIYYRNDTPESEPDHHTDERGPGHRQAALAEAAGQGCRALVWLNPAAPPHHDATGLLRVPDVSLVHELVHAISITHGGFRPARVDAVAARFHAPSLEEGRAVVIENMYRDESRYLLRREYLDGGAIAYGATPTSRNTGTPIGELEADTVRHFRLRAPGLASELERIPAHVCRYNPFRDLHVHRSPLRSAR